MSPELIAKIKKWATSLFAVALVIIGVLKPEWASKAQEIFANIGIGLDAFIAAVSGIIILLSSGNLSVKNVL
jgi:hypothetical protein